MGDATRPSGKNGNHLTDGNRLKSKARVLIQELRDRHSDDFRSVLCPKAVKSKVESTMKEARIDDSKIITFGRETSNNAFKGERVGLVIGCLDPGDDYVLDILAELKLEAEPKTNECEKCGGGVVSLMLVTTVSDGHKAGNLSDPTPMKRLKSLHPSASTTPLSLMVATLDNLTIQMIGDSSIIGRTQYPTASLTLKYLVSNEPVETVRKA